MPRPALVTVTSLAAGLVALLAGARAHATTYQVGPTRTHKQLSAVAPLLAPGDRVEVDGGATYTGGVVFDRPGTAAQPITIVGVPAAGKRPVVSGGTNTIEARGGHYVFEQLDLTAGSFRCFFHHADDVTLRDSVVHDCPAHGILGADSDAGSFLLQRTEVHHCGAGTQEHQIYMSSDEVKFPGAVFRMEASFVHDGQGGNNVKSRAARNELYGNWIEGATYHEIELIGSETSPEAAVREDSDVVGNVLVKRNAFFVARFGGDGTGQTNGRYRFVNNTVVTMGGSAVFRLMDGIDTLEVHNSVFAARTGAVALVDESAARWVSGASTIAGAKNWIQTGATKVPAALVGTVSGASTTLFVDLAGNDLRPKQGSPLVDAGGTTFTGPAGKAFPNPLALPNVHPPGHVAPAATTEGRMSVGAVDLGAFELGGATAAPPNSPGAPSNPAPPNDPAGDPTSPAASGGGDEGATGAAGTAAGDGEDGVRERPLAMEGASCATSPRSPRTPGAGAAVSVLVVLAAMFRRRQARSFLAARSTP